MRGKGLALLLAAVMAMQGSAVCVCAENEQSGASSEDAQAAVSVAEGRQDTSDEEALAGSSSGVDDGVYVFSSGIRSDRVLDIAGASSQSGASLQLYEDNYSSAQKYRVTKNSDGRTYTIAPLCSDKVLDVAGGNKIAERRSGSIRSTTLKHRSGPSFPTGTEAILLYPIFQERCLIFMAHRQVSG